MGAKAESWLLAAVPLWMCFGRAAALSEPEICYVLDGILFLYGRHPDRALLQDQDLQRQRGQRWERKVKADCGRGHLHGFDSSQAGHI